MTEQDKSKSFSPDGHLNFPPEWDMKKAEHNLMVPRVSLKNFHVDLDKVEEILLVDPKRPQTNNT